MSGFLLGELPKLQLGTSILWHQGVVQGRRDEPDPERQSGDDRARRLHSDVGEVEGLQENRCSVDAERGGGGTGRMSVLCELPKDVRR